MRFMANHCKLPEAKEPDFLADSKTMKLEELARKYEISERTALNTRNRLVKKEQTKDDPASA